MSDLHVGFVSKSFLRSHWDLEYRAWRDSETEKALDDRLALWAKRRDLKETSAESAFIDVFFRETWGMSKPASGVPRSTSTTIYGRLPRKAIFLVSAAWNARIYPACCWSDRAPGLDGSPLLLAL